MTNESKRPKSRSIEARIIEAIKAEKLKLRFDRVVLRLAGDLKANLASTVPYRHSVVFTVTAPIRNPAKTAQKMEGIVREGVAEGDLRRIIQGNRVRISYLPRVARNAPKVIVLVHNPDSDPALMMRIAESQLRPKR